MLQAIQQLASDLAKQINENKSEEGYTIMCTYRELRHMVSEATLAAEDVRESIRQNVITFAMNDLFEEMQYEHNLFLTVSQYDDVVIDERPDVVKFEEF